MRLIHALVRAKIIFVEVFCGALPLTNTVGPAKCKWCSFWTQRNAEPEVGLCWVVRNDVCRAILIGHVTLSMICRAKPTRDRAIMVAAVRHATGNVVIHPVCPRLTLVHTKSLEINNSAICRAIYSRDTSVWSCCAIRNGRFRWTHRVTPAYGALVCIVLALCHTLPVHHAVSAGYLFVISTYTCILAVPDRSALLQFLAV